MYFEVGTYFEDVFVDYFFACMVSLSIYIYILKVISFIVSM